MSYPVSGLPSPVQLRRRARPRDPKAENFMNTYVRRSGISERQCREELQGLYEA